MGFIIDLILILAFAFSIITAYRKGLLKSLLDSFGFIISVVFASKTAEYSHMWIYENFFRESIIESIRNEIANSAATQTAGQVSSSFFETRKILSDFASLIGLDTDGPLKESLKIDLSAENAAELLTETVVQPILTVIIKYILFFVLSVVFIVALTILTTCLTKAMKETPLNGVNKVFGGIFGVVKGIVAVALLIVLIVLLAALIENEDFDSMVSSSRIFEFLNTQSDVFKIN